MTDIAPGWTLCRVVPKKGQRLVFEALETLRDHLPFPLLGIESDNGSKFINHQEMLDLLWHTCLRWKLWPDQVTAVTTYGIIENIIPVEDAGIVMYSRMPNWDKCTSYFGASLFTY